VKGEDLGQGDGKGAGAHGRIDGFSSLGKVTGGDVHVGSRLWVKAGCIGGTMFEALTLMKHACRPRVTVTDS